MKRIVYGLLLASLLIVPSSAKASEATDAAILAQLKALNDTIVTLNMRSEAFSSRLDKIEKGQQTAATNQVRTALNRVPQPNNSASLNQALNQTQGQCASGKCGQSR
jgi:uncharacterized protein YkwD